MEIFPGDPENVDEGLFIDKEVEERVEDWLELNRVENGSPCATLYKLVGPKNETREQVDYFRGIIPTRHEIGLDYGPGYYLMIIRNTTASKGVKSTSIRFTLADSYNEKHLKHKREQAERERLALGQSNGLPSAIPQAQKDPGETLKEAFGLVRLMQAETLAIFKPILERALAPAAPLALPAPVTPFQDYALSRQIMKDSLKESMSMMNLMQKTMIENHSAPGDLDDEEKDPDDEKKSMFDKIIALAEPFINILAQNNMAAKMAAAGIKAAPQFKEVLQDAGLARRIVQYVETKEGPERAGIALKNLGINPADYIGPSARPPVPTPRAPVQQKQANKPPARGPQAPGKAGKVVLNPKMEIKQ
jgi:hypothetical protein